MLSVALRLAMTLVTAAIGLSLYRLLRGPSLVERVLGLDTLYVNTVAMLLLLGMELRTSLHFEAVLLIAMLGFVGTCTLAKFLLRGDIME